MYVNVNSQIKGLLGEPPATPRDPNETGFYGQSRLPSVFVEQDDLLTDAQMQQQMRKHRAAVISNESRDLPAFLLHPYAVCTWRA